MLKKFMLSLLAGLAIAFGGIVFLSIKSLSTLPIINVIASYTFSVGLFLVLAFGLWLYTGKIGYAFEKKFSLLDFTIMIFGNLCGAMILGYICFFTLKSTSLFTSNYQNTILKLDNLNELKLLLSGILCGMFVYLAVEAFKIKKLHLIVRVFLVVLFIGTFVILKLNHCVANMFYFSFASTWNLTSIWFVIINIVSNSLGAIILNTLKVFISKKTNVSS